MWDENENNIFEDEFYEDDREYDVNLYRTASSSYKFRDDFSDDDDETERLREY